MHQARRHRRIGVQGLLDGVADGHELALAAGHRAADHEQPPVRIHGRDLEVQRGHPLNAEMASHLLVLERLARILPVTRGTVRPVRDGHTVRRLQAAEVPALHAAGEALALGHAADVHHLADDEMRSGQGLARLQRCIRRDAELAKPHLRLHLQPGIVPLVRVGDILHLGLAPAELDGAVAVPLRRPDLDYLHLVQVQHGDGDVRAVLFEQPGHAQLLGDQAGAHRIRSLKLDLDVHAAGQVELHQRVDGLRRGLDDVEETAMSPDLELLAALLVHVG